MSTRAEIRNRVSRDLGDPDNDRFSVDLLNTSLQEAYNLVAIKLGCIQKSIPFPFPTDTPYINLRQFIPDYFAPIGIYNFKTNRWLDPVNHKILNNMRWDWERWIGEPTNCFMILDFSRIAIFPYQTEPTGTFLLWYWAHQTLDETGAIVIPESSQQILENYAAADVLDLDGEIIKAKKYWIDFMEEIPDLDREVNLLAGYDKNLVLEPYWPLGLYGPGGDVHFVDNIIPVGVINGINDTFTLPQNPNPTASLLLMKNGQCLFEGIAYTLTGDTIVYNSLFIPQPGQDPDNIADVHRVWYRVI